MTQNPPPQPWEIPEELKSMLPADAEEMDAHAHISCAPDGSMEGETVMVLYQGRLQLFTRPSRVKRFFALHLVPGTQPRMEERAGRLMVVMETRGSGVRSIPVSPAEAASVQQVLEQLRQPAPFETSESDDDEDAPTLVMEGTGSFSFASLGAMLRARIQPPAARGAPGPAGGAGPPAAPVSEEPSAGGAPPPASEQPDSGPPAGQEAPADEPPAVDEPRAAAEEAAADEEDDLPQGEADHTAEISIDVDLEDEGTQDRILAQDMPPAAAAREERVVVPAPAPPAAEKPVLVSLAELERLLASAPEDAATVLELQPVFLEMDRGQEEPTTTASPEPVAAPVQQDDAQAPEAEELVSELPVDLEFSDDPDLKTAPQDSALPAAVEQEERLTLPLVEGDLIQVAEPEEGATQPLMEDELEEVPESAPKPEHILVVGSAPAAPAAPPQAAPPPAEAASRARRKTIFSGEDLHRRYHAHIQQDNDLDAAFCVADALVYMGKAREGVRLFHEHHRPKSLQRTDRVITDRTWQTYVQHPGEDPDISALMAVISQALGSATTRKPRAFGLREEDRRDVSTDLLQVSRVFEYSCRVLGVGPVDLYVEQDRAAGLLYAHTQPAPSLLAGADLLKGRHQNELTFLVGRQIALLKPQYFLVNVMPSASQLRVSLLAAITLAIPRLDIPGPERKTVEATRKLLHKHLPSGPREQVKALVARLTSRQSGVDLDDWFFKVQLTADRAGLLLSQDLVNATKVIDESPQLPGAPPANRRIQDLVRYCLSPEYSAIRKDLGLTVA